jgi:hypothetical protein
MVHRLDIAVRTLSPTFGRMGTWGSSVAALLIKPTVNL